MRKSYKALYLQEVAARQAAENKVTSAEQRLVALANSDVILKREQIVTDDLNAKSIFIANGGSLLVNGECHAVIILCFDGVMNLGKGFSVGNLEVKAT